MRIFKHRFFQSIQYRHLWWYIAYKTFQKQELSTHKESTDNSTDGHWTLVWQLHSMIIDTKLEQTNIHVHVVAFYTTSWPRKHFLPCSQTWQKSWIINVHINVIFYGLERRNWSTSVLSVTIYKANYNLKKL